MLRASGSDNADDGADINGFYPSNEDLWQDDFAGRRLYGKSLFCSIFRALYYKRALIARRDFGSTCSQTIVPIIAVIAFLAAILFAAMPISSSRARVEFSLQNTYGSKDVLPKLPRFSMPMFHGTTEDDITKLREDFLLLSDVNAHAIRPSAGLIDPSLCNSTDAYNDAFNTMFATYTEFQFSYAVGQFCHASNLYPNVSVPQFGLNTSRTTKTVNSIATTNSKAGVSVVHSMLFVNSSVALALQIATTGLANAMLVGAHRRQSDALSPGEAKPPLAQLTVSHNIVGISSSWFSLVDLFNAYVYIVNLVTVAMIVLASTFGHVIVLERLNSSKQLQLVSGASAWSYWIAHAAWDLTVSLFVSVPCIIVFCLMLTGTVKTVLLVIVSFLLTTMSSIVLAYCVALFAQTPSKCQIYLYGIHAISTIMSAAILVVLLFSSNGSDLFSTIVTYVCYVLYILLLCTSPMASFIAFIYICIGNLSFVLSSTAMYVLLFGSFVCLLFYSGLLIIFEKRTRQVRATLIYIEVHVL